jgi:hypothetical protein
LSTSIAVLSANNGRIVVSWALAINARRTFQQISRRRRTKNAQRRIA